MILTYCTNVHPSDGLDALEAALAGPVARVRDAVGGEAGVPFPIGAWLSARTVRDLERPGALDRLTEALARERLFLATVNAFPFGDFHAPAVKRDVYRPDWKTPERIAYTLSSARLAAALSPLEEIPLSTLPGGFKPWGSEDADRIACARNLARCAEGLARLEAETGKRVLLCLEPEPFGLVESTDEAVRFFKEFLWRAGSEAQVRRHVGICFDACHVAVGFEPFEAAYAALRGAGIAVGKVQVSSALEAAGGSASLLGRFDEPRYLHQTAVASPGAPRAVFEDLGAFLKEAGSVPPDARVRTHFHVPLFWEGEGGLSTTSPALARFLKGLAARPSGMPLLEIETYTWGVLPDPPAGDAALATGVAREFAWVRAALGG